MTAAIAECYVVSRTIAATPAEIFAVLVDPTRHKDTEPVTGSATPSMTRPSPRWVRCSP